MQSTIKSKKNQQRNGDGIQMRELTDAAITAKAIRKELKEIFKTIKFSIRSKTYAGGDHVTIEWTDGPSEKMVRKVANKYEGGTFDPYSDYHGWDSTGIPEGIPGVHFIFYTHNTTEELKAAARDSYKKTYGEEPPNNKRYIEKYYEKIKEWGTPELIAIKEKQDKEEAAAEAAKRAEEAKEEEERRKKAIEIFEKEKAAGSKIIEKAMAKYPANPNENKVIIHWSEHPAFYDYDENHPLKLSMKAADIILDTLDYEYCKNHPEGGYDKTSYSIESPTGENLFKDRYDLGDNNGGLLHELYRYDKIELLLNMMPEEVKGIVPMSPPPVTYQTIKALNEEYPVEGGEYIQIEECDHIAFRYNPQEEIYSLRAAACLFEKVYDEYRYVSLFRAGYADELCFAKKIIKFKLMSVNGEYEETYTWQLDDKRMKNLLEELRAETTKREEEKPIIVSTENPWETLLDMSPKEKPKTTKKPEIVNTDRIPYVKYTLNKLSNKELALLAAMAAVEDIHTPMPKKLGEMVRKTPMYKRAHIAAVLQQAFHKAKE